jgi:hypothetical protein
MRLPFYAFYAAMPRYGGSRERTMATRLWRIPLERLTSTRERPHNNASRCLGGGINCQHAPAG